MIYDITTVLHGGDPVEIQVEWPKDAVVQSFGPGTLVLLAKKTVRPCSNVTLVARYETYDNHVDDVVVSSWSTTMEAYVVPDGVPDPTVQWWEGEQEFVVMLAAKQLLRDVRGTWQAGLIALGKAADGTTYGTWTLPAKS